MVDFADWPVLPETLRPKPLYHRSAMTEDMEQALRGAGWLPIDIRTMPETNDDEKILAVKAYLQGIRLGSISAPTRGYFAELEARVLGLMANKRPDKPKDPMNSEDLEGILGPLAVKQGKK